MDIQFNNTPSREIFKKQFLFSTLLTIFWIPVSGQSINLTLQSSDTLRSSGAYTIINDINGDPCSLAIIQSTYDNLKFYTNRSVEKVVREDSRYLVWISNGSTVLKIVIPGYPLIEYDLKINQSQPIVYLFILDATYNSSQSVRVYKDTLDPIFSINTNPDKALVFINNYNLGKTPFVVPNGKPGQKFDYKIVKAGYETVKGTDSIRTNDYIMVLDLIQQTMVKIRFVELLLGDSDVGGAHLPLYGLSYGNTGGTGWYMSTKFSYSFNPVEKAHVDSKLNRLRISGGITKNLSRILPLYCKLGTGYAYKKLGAVYNTNNDLQEYNALYFDIGLMLKLGKRIFISFEYSPVFGKSITQQPGNLSGDVKEHGFIDYDYFAGIAYAFN
jgi:hypothetical protein